MLKCTFYCCRGCGQKICCYGNHISPFQITWGEAMRSGSLFHHEFSLTPTRCVKNTLYFAITKMASHSGHITSSTLAAAKEVPRARVWGDQCEVFPQRACSGLVQLGRQHRTVGHAHGDSPGLVERAHQSSGNLCVPGGRHCSGKHITLVGSMGHAVSCMCATVLVVSSELFMGWYSEVCL